MRIDDEILAASTASITRLTESTALDAREIALAAIQAALPLIAARFADMARKSGREAHASMFCYQIGTSERSRCAGASQQAEKIADLFCQSIQHPSDG